MMVSTMVNHGWFLEHLGTSTAAVALPASVARDAEARLGKPRGAEALGRERHASLAAALLPRCPG